MFTKSLPDRNGRTKIGNLVNIVVGAPTKSTLTRMGVVKWNTALEPNIPLSKSPKVALNNRRHVINSMVPLIAIGTFVSYDLRRGTRLTIARSVLLTKNGASTNTSASRRNLTDEANGAHGMRLNLSFTIAKIVATKTDLWHLCPLDLPPNKWLSESTEVIAPSRPTRSVKKVMVITLTLRPGRFSGNSAKSILLDVAFRTVRLVNSRLQFTYFVSNFTKTEKPSTMAPFPNPNKSIKTMSVKEQRATGILTAFRLSIPTTFPKKTKTSRKANRNRQMDTITGSNTDPSRETLPKVVRTRAIVEVSSMFAVTLFLTLAQSTLRDDVDSLRPKTIFYNKLERFLTSGH